MRVLLAGVLMAFVVLPAYAFPSVVSGSYYHAQFEGRLMACGGRFDSDDLTAASNNHPCGARLRVTYKERDVVVQVTDRCGRCGIDLTRAAARELGLLRVGRAPVRVERLAGGPPRYTVEPPAPGLSAEPVPSAWVQPSSPSDRGNIEPPYMNQAVTAVKAHARHVGAVPMAPIPSTWIMRSE